MASFTRLAVALALAVTLVKAAPAMEARDQVIPMTTMTFTRVEWTLIPNSPYLTTTASPFTVTWVQPVLSSYRRPDCASLPIDNSRLLKMHRQRRRRSSIADMKGFIMQNEI
ncbi:hypothetical protein IW261DRAFT_637918 [Armillaria novae-zelandiae]|uniref:Uncharacterized protein n=1 Tax=Armillaria novae-zelandiae TaxID=153914 RepID=A0AA39PNW1_9AGAR|nr:hypothetical protein IW261DRAFT_637918 [Armillaria novae-zelandiae]